MAALQNAPEHASLPDLLMLVAGSKEFEGIRLRRGEKKVLNAINKSIKDGRIRFCIPQSSSSRRPAERISTSQEKIFILVSMCLAFCEC